MRKRNNTSNLVAAIATVAQQNPSGFTYNIRTGKMQTTGYAVAVAETQNSFGKAGLKKVVEYAIRHHIPCIGGWLNSDNGRYYFDATMILKDREAAIEAGRKNSQLGIFDLDHCEEIRIS